MQIESYEREIKTFAIGGKWGDAECPITIPNPQALKVEFLYCGKPLTDERWKREMTPYIESDLLPFEDKNPGDSYFDDYRFFDKHYSDIVRGKCKGWEVAHAEITPTAIMLDYDYPGNHNDDLGPFCWVMLQRDITVRITAPKNRYGFTPVYLAYRNGEEMWVEANLGYMRRFVRLRVKDPTNQKNYLQRDNQIAVITDYTDI